MVYRATAFRTHKIPPPPGGSRVRSQPPEHRSAAPARALGLSGSLALGLSRARSLSKAQPQPAASQPAASQEATPP